MTREKAIESGYCTAKWCRKVVDAGAGIQFVDEQGVMQRYCWDCWRRYCASLETKKDSHDKPRNDGGCSPS